MADSLLGKEVAGQFRITSRIGTGGMGSVYLAQQPSMNREVAIKVLHSKYAARADVSARFRREARAMSQLSHPHTARVFLFGELDNGCAYFVMEYLKGRNLAQVVRAEGPMGPERALNIMVQVCGALDEAHKLGIIHRDLKPENIFLTQQGGIRDYPKVLDFGLAKVTQKQMRPDSIILTKQGMVFGTPEFMSPEQAQGKELDARSDIYALGMILYELLTGRLPFDARNALEFMKAQVTSEPIRLNDRSKSKQFSAQLETAIMKALEKDAGKRYPTAAEFGLALKGCLTGAAVSSARHAIAGAAVPSTKTRSARAAATEPTGPVSAPSNDAHVGVGSSAAATPTPPPSARSPVPLVLVGFALGLSVAGAVAAAFWALG
ncbi:MAG: serine/threonine protein kinase [Proteobacteria bacterium]|nr:serine/threonine protein kinase [Pseudomonadota bacterium]